MFVSTLLVSFTALGCVAPGPAPREGATVPHASGSSLEPGRTAADLVAAHNQVRAEHNLPLLAASGPLQAAAEVHARDMAHWHIMSHRGSDLSTPFRRMSAQGYTFRRAAENVAAGQGSVDSVMKGWMRSPGHRLNILGKYSEIGAACATASDGTPYWCVTFGEAAGG
jgi:uncharacterized protein YkwD